GAVLGARRAPAARGRRSPGGLPAADGPEQGQRQSPHGATGRAGNDRGALPRDCPRRAQLLWRHTCATNAAHAVCSHATSGATLEWRTSLMHAPETESCSAIETLCATVDEQPASVTRPLSMPIVAASVFAADSLDDLAAITAG